MITPTQCRMARAALQLSLRELGTIMDLSAMALSRYESGDLSVISVETIGKLQAYFESEYVFFGSSDGVSVGENIFQTEQWLSLACYELLREAGMAPTGHQLLKAYERVVRNLSPHV